MDELNALIEWAKTEKGITKIALEDLIDLVPEYELWYKETSSYIKQLKRIKTK